MITDQKQTGVPDGARGRMQLTNPVQTNNNGRVQPNQQATLQKMQNRLSEAYNPIMAKGESDVTESNLGTNNLTRGAQEYVSQAYTDLDAARTAFNKLTDKDKMSLLNEIANGGASKASIY